MKKFLLSITIFFSCLYSFAQCPTGAIVFSTQQEINDFIVDYPNCTQLPENVTIQGTVSNLQSFANIEGFSKSLVIQNTALVDLSGLNLVENIGSSLWINDNPNLGNLTGLIALATINEDFIVSGNTNLTTLSGIDNIVNIRRRLEISQNNNLTSLNGLEKIREIGRVGQESDYSGLHIVGNGNLPVLTGLNNLRIIRGSLQIIDNDALTNLSGLDGVYRVGDILTISDNQNLLNLEGLNTLSLFKEDGNTANKGIKINNNQSLTSLVGIGEIIEFEDKITIWNNENLTALDAFHNMEKLGDAEVYGNAKLVELNAFENVLEIERDLEIFLNPKLISINAFQNLKKIEKLIISQNDDLSNIDELANLTDAREINIKQNNSLLNLNGLVGITEMNDFKIIQNNSLNALGQFTSLANLKSLDISKNPLLASLEGLESLTTVIKSLFSNGTVLIEENNSLTDLKGLDGLRKAGDRLAILNNAALLSLDGLESLDEVVKQIDIEENPVLSDISALSNVNISGKQNDTRYRIKFNTSLATCNIESLCHYIRTDRYWLLEGNTGDCIQNTVSNLCNYEYNKIEGNLSFRPTNDDCNGPRSDMANTKISTENNGTIFSTFTDDQGRYRLYTKDGNNTVSPQFIESRFESIARNLPATTNFPDFGDTYHLDFCGHPAGTLVEDFRVMVFPIRGTNQGNLPIYRIVYQNIGNAESSAKLYLNFDSNRISHAGGSPRQTSKTTDELIWNFQSFAPMESKAIDVIFRAGANPNDNPDNNPLMTARLELSNQDVNETDNIYELNIPFQNDIVGNTLSILEGDEIEDNKLNEYLNFVIYFQNISNSEVNFLRLEQTLTGNLDWETFEPIKMSHDGHLRITDGNKIEYIFYDIELTPQSEDEEDSRGYIAYRIKPKSSVAVNDIVEGSGAIYFDNNLPIATNSAKITVVSSDIDGDGILNEDDNCPEIENPGQEDSDNNGIGDVCDIQPLQANSLLTAPISCNGSQDATIQIDATGGETPYIFELFDDSNNLIISQASNIFMNIGIGTYNTRVIDNTSQEIFGNPITITEPEQLITTINSSAPTCNGSQNGTIEILASGGVAPYQYQINSSGHQTSNVFSNLSPGTYTTETIDNNGCTYTSLITIEEPAPLLINSFVQNVSCSGQNDGIINLQVSGGTGPYEYFLDGNSMGNIITDLAPGLYAIEIVDSKGCNSLNEFVITEPEPLIASIEVTVMTCFESNDAQATRTATGGTPPYEFSIDGGVSYLTTNTFENLVAGSYIAMVRDSNGCQIDLVFEVANGLEINPEINTTNTSCNGDNGSITITESENTAEYLYRINGGELTSETYYSDLASGTYEVGILNSNGCQVTRSITVLNSEDCHDFSLPVDNFILQTTSETCASSNNGSIQITAVENNNYTATLNNGSQNIDKTFSTSTSFLNLEAGFYEVCLTVEGEPEYEQCFSIQITEPEELDINSVVDTSGKLIMLKMKGGVNYTINLNGTEYYTSESRITLPLSKTKNSLSVNTEVACQGTYEETILSTTNSVSVYPNPVEKGDLTVFISNTLEGKVELMLFTDNSVLVAQENRNANNGTVQLNMDGIPSGVYTLSITTETQNYIRRIIKK